MSLLLIVASTATDSPPPPNWGGNATTYAWRATVNMTDVADAPFHPSNATYVGQSVVDGHTVDEWLAYGASDNHYYATTDGSRTPVRYFEHKHGMQKQWDFFSYAAGAPPRSKFEPPPGCTTSC